MSPPASIWPGLLRTRGRSGSQFEKCSSPVIVLPVPPSLTLLLRFKSLRQMISLTAIPGTSAFLRRPHPSSLFLWHAHFITFVLKTVKPPIFCREQKLFYMLSIIANVYPVLWPQTCPKFNPKRWFSVLLTASN